MPQLEPILFINQYIWSVSALIIITFVIAKYFLPLFTLTNVSRLYVTKI